MTDTENPHTSPVSPSLYSQLDDLIGYRFHVKQKKMTHQNGLVSSGSGGHQALRKGRGMIFSEVRPYQAGDDIRHIDWRVTARTQKTHTKVFIEEHERPTLLITEQTSALFFGTKTRLKTAQALNITAILSWVALAQNERVGGLTFNDTQHAWVAPKRSTQTLLHHLQQSISLQQHLTQPKKANPTHWQATLKQLTRVIKPGSKVFLVGDMMQLTQESFAYIQKLAKHNDMVAIHIYDSLEKSLPNQGWLSMTLSLASGSLFKINSGRATTREAYAQLYETQWQTAKERFTALKLPLIEIGCHQDPIASLLAHKVIR
ncbi:MAG: DUF58 domain-containing protein [Gammaproteobacteria bacterium]|nr:DUF58 domain-containing protein [Gammaproteobacteria bacterium]